MLPDEVFLFTAWLAIHNTQLNDMQRENQERIERKIDLILEKMDLFIESEMKKNGKS